MRPLQVGEPAPQFKLTSLDNNSMTCDTLGNNVWVINLFAYTCDACLEELPAFESKFWQVYKDSAQVNVLAIGRGHTEDQLRAFRDSTGYTFPMVADADRAIYNQFARIMIPRNIIIGRDGLIKFHTVGFNDRILQEMQRIIAEELNQISSYQNPDNL